MKKYLLICTLVLCILSTYAQTNDAKRAYNKGLLAFNADDYLTAIISLEDAIFESPTFYHAHRLLAECYDLNNQLNKAVAQYNVLIQMTPEDEKLYYNLSLVYISKKDFAKSVELLEQALLIQPNYTLAHNKLGRVKETYFQDFMGAEFHYEMALKNVETTSCNIEYALAANFYRRGRYKKSLKAIDGVLKESTSPKMHFLAGLCYNKLNRRNEAIYSYERVLTLNKNYESAYINLGIIYYNNNDFKRASSSFMSASYINPNNPKIYKLLGQTFFKNNEFDKALTALKRAVISNGRDGETHYLLAKIYEHKGDTANSSSHVGLAKKNGYSVQNFASK